MIPFFEIECKKHFQEGTKTFGSTLHQDHYFLIKITIVLFQNNKHQYSALFLDQMYEKL